MEETKKTKVKKVFGVLSKVGTGLLAFGLALVGMYMLTPNRVRKLNTKFGDDTVNQTHFDQFIQKVTSYPEEGLDGLHAELEDFEINYKTSDTAPNNNIKLDASIDFVMRNLNDLEFTLISEVDYNGKKLPLVVGYTDSTIYFRVKDLALKSSSTGTDEIISTLEQYVLALPEDGGLGINPIKKLEQSLNELTSNIDISSLLGKFTSGDTSFDFSTEEVQLPNKDWKFTLNLSLTTKELVSEATELTEAVYQDKVNNFTIVIITDEEYNFKTIDLGTISIGNVTIKGKINCVIAPLTIVKPDDPAHPKFDENVTYVEIASYKGWIQKLADLFAETNQTASLSFDLDLSDANTEIGRVLGDINIDFSELVDLSSWHFDEDYTTDEEEPIRSHLTRGVDEEEPEEDEEESLVDKIRNGLKLGVDVQLIGQNNANYANLGLKYLDDTAYINFNESTEKNTKKSVMKAKADTETLNWLVNEMPGMISDIAGDETYQSMSSLFDFVTGSELVTAMKDGDFSGILDVLKTLRNDNEKIYLGLDLSSLGLGNSSEVNLTLDSSTEEGHKVLDLSVRNLEVGSMSINMDLESADYDEVFISEEEAATYDSISFLPDVFSQVSGILKEKKVAFDLEGSVLDKDNLGLRLNGNANFDYGEKHGFGTLEIDQYKYRSNEVWYNHQITLDVDNRNANKSLNNARFIYGSNRSNSEVKGRFTVQTILDIIDLVTEFINENAENPRFSKFITPLMELMGMSTISEIVDAKDYLRFAKNDLIQEISQFGGGLGLKVVVGGEMLGLSSNIDLRINFNSLEDRSIKSIEVKDLVLGSAPEAGEEDTRKTLNIELTLTEYNENAISPVNPEDNYLDFSDIKVLLQFGLNTTKLGVYNLEAAVTLKWGIFNVNLPIKFYIVVKNSYVKVYGSIDSVPNFSVLVQEHLLSTKIKSELTFETYPSGDPHKTNDIGGYFTIKKTTDPLLGSNSYYYYRSTSKNFIVADNLIYYLACGLVDIKSSYITDSIGSIGSSDSEEKVPGDYPNVFTSTGFVYDESATKWDIGINLGALLSKEDVFPQGLELSLYGSEIGGVGYFTKLEVETYISFSILKNMHITATIELKNIDPDATDWSNTIQSKFNAVNGYNIPSSYLDKLSYYKR